MGADQQPDVLEPPAGLMQRPLELLHRARLVDAGVEKNDPVALARSAKALTWGTPGHGSGSRSRQMPGSTRSARPCSRLRRSSLILARWRGLRRWIPLPEGVELVRAQNPSPLTLSGTNTYLVGRARGS